MQMPPGATALILALLALSAPETPISQAGGTTLVVADATAPPPALDPFKVFGTQAQSFFRQIFAPLFDRDPDGRLIAPLLEGWKQVNPRTWEFRLRPGILFHDGGELGANDVVFSLNRILDPQVNSPRRHDFSELHEIVALDRRTIRVVTKSPYSLLPARLSQFSMIVPANLRGRSEAEFFQNPVGLGPFMLGEVTSQEATLVAFPNYFAGPPKISRLVFRFVPDPAERVQQLLKGSVDILTNLPPQQAEDVIRERHTVLLKRHSIRFMNVMLDTNIGPLANLEVRKALRYGTDVEGLVRYVARGNGRPLATVTLPEDFGFNPDLRPYPFDPTKARALLAQAGYGNGFNLAGIATHATQILATAISQQWARLGVTLEIEVEDRAKATQRWIKEPGRYSVRFLDPTSIIFDASFQLRLHVDRNHPVARSPHPRALELLDRADDERDPVARAALLREAQVVAHEQALAVTLYQVVDLYGVRDRVKGFVPSADTILRLAGVSLAP